MGETVLVIAPHPDDEAIGCGGMICLHRRRGDVVHIVFLTSGERGLEEMPAARVRSIREPEAQAAAKVLGAKSIHFLRLPDQRVTQSIQHGARLLRPVLDRYEPHLIYLPHPQEAHPDHEAALPLVRQALANGFAGALPELRGYEIWSPMVRFGWVEDITPVMPQKLRAVRCYLSQLALLPYDRAIRGLNEYRGAIAAGSRYAEAFQYLHPRGPKKRDQARK